MALVKFGTESMLVEMFKKPNLEEIWFAKSKTTKFPQFVRSFKFSHLFLIIFEILVMLHHWNQLAAMS